MRFDIPHPMHQTVDQALALIKTLKPRRAWFTHIAHDLPHAETNERLRKLGFDNVHLAYDGLKIEVRVDESTDSGPASSSPRTHRETLAVFSSSRAWAERYAVSRCG